MTIEQLHAHADQLEKEGLLSEYSFLTANAVTSDSDQLIAICRVYKKVKPFLEVYVSLFFIPKKWKAPVKTLLVMLDTICVE